jgi:hypothetical protein
VLQDPVPLVKQQGGSGLKSEPNLHLIDLVYITSVPEIMTRVFPPSGPSEGVNDEIFQFLMNENVALIVENVFPFIVNDIFEGKKAFLTKNGGNREYVIE